MSGYQPDAVAGNCRGHRCGRWVRWEGSKPFTQPRQTGRRVSELMHEAGVPRDVFAPVYGGGDAGAALVAQPLDGVFFTGSSKVRGAR